MQRQRRVALAPHVADPRLAVDHQRRHVERGQPGGDREAVVAGAEDHHGRLAVLEGGLLLAVGGPAAAVLDVAVDLAVRAVVAGRARGSAAGRRPGSRSVGGEKAVAGRDQEHVAAADPLLGGEVEEGLDLSSKTTGASSGVRAKPAGLAAAPQSASRATSSLAADSVADVPAEGHEVTPGGGLDEERLEALARTAGERRPRTSGATRLRPRRRRSSVNSRGGAIWVLLTLLLLFLRSRGCGRYLIAIGFTGEPTAPVTFRGGATSWNSKTPSSAQSAASPARFQNCPSIRPMSRRQRQ